MLLTKVQTHFNKQNANILKKAKVVAYAPLNFGRHLGHLEPILDHLESDKNFSSMKYVQLKYKLKSKNRTPEYFKLITEL
jgi:hypothetical protein